MRNNRLWWIAGGIALAALIGVVALLFNPRSPDGPETIRIGAILPLTGDLAYLGEGDQRALRLYTESHPEVDFLYGDSKAAPREALTVTRRLLDRGVKYHITSLSYVVNSIQPVLDEAEALNFTLNMDPRSEEGSPYVFRLYVTFYDEMDMLEELAVERNASKVAVVYPNVESMNNAVESYLRPKLEERGVELVTETFEIGEGNFRDLILKVDKGGQTPDIVRIIDFGDKLQVILNQIAQLDAFPEAMIVSGIETLVINHSEVPEEIANRFMFTSPDLIILPENPVVQAYTDRYGSRPTFDAMFAYDIAGLLVPAIQRQGYGNVEGVIEDITSQDTYHGAAATYTIEDDGGVSPDIFWAEIVDGRPELVKGTQ